MLKAFLKKALLVSLIGVIFLSFSHQADAYVSVKGYTKKNGTYVAPYVRSNPNGLKYDNYGYKPSQGLYNPTYGTRGAAWDTPTYITDPNYYQGKAIYDSLHSGGSSGTSLPTPSKPTVHVPANAALDYWGTGWNCNSGYTRNYSTNLCDKVIVPAHASLSYLGDDWTCDRGYERNYTSNRCDKVIVPANASLNYLGDDWSCNSGYSKNYLTNRCDKVLIPAHASLNYLGDDWTCNRGYGRNYLTDKCDKVIIPAHGSLNYFGDDWTCNDGYERNYSTDRCDRL